MPGDAKLSVPSCAKQCQMIAAVPLSLMMPICVRTVTLPFSSALLEPLVNWPCGRSEFGAGSLAPTPKMHLHWSWTDEAGSALGPARVMVVGSNFIIAEIALACLYALINSLLGSAF